MRVEMDLRASDAGVSGLAVEWFETAAEGLFSPLLRSLRNGPELCIAKKGEGVLGSPGGIWASLTEQDPLQGRVRVRKAWSEGNWSKFLASVAKRPADSEFWILELSEQGRRYGASQAKVSVQSVSTDGEWNRLRVEYGAGEPGAHSCHRIISSLDVNSAVEHLRRFALRVPITFGCVTDDGGHGGETMLEDRLGLSPLKGIQESQDVLRGYPWVTVCSARIADRLGGVARLRESGAFKEVEELPTGSVWLRATDRLDDYTGEALRSVFRVVAPALPPGRPRPYVGREIGRLVYEDPVVDTV
ncbi:hypothetical protein [Streptomyces olivaceoviridis]